MLCKCRIGPIEIATMNENRRERERESDGFYRFFSAPASFSFIYMGSGLDGAVVVSYCRCRRRRRCCCCYVQSEQMCSDSFGRPMNDLSNPYRFLWCARCAHELCVPYIYRASNHFDIVKTKQPSNSIKCLTYLYTFYLSCCYFCSFAVWNHFFSCFECVDSIIWSSFFSYLKMLNGLQ